MRKLIVVAHPDDETIGAGIWMKRHAYEDEIHVLHVTDGSPKDGIDAAGHGFPSRESYAGARRLELAHALQFIPISNAFCHSLPVPDKDAYLMMEQICAEVGAVVEELRPHEVLCPAYEGGHPDHDVAALAVAFSRRRHPFRHLEFPLYRADSLGQMVVQTFLDEAAEQPLVLPLTPPERELKREMLRCFRTQEAMISFFSLDQEQFRPAPRYDFTRPPHIGKLLYEIWDWGISGRLWSERAHALLNRAALPQPLR